MSSEAITRKATLKLLTLECGHTMTDLVPDTGPRMLTITCLQCRAKTYGFPYGEPLRRITKMRNVKRA